MNTPMVERMNVVIVGHVDHGKSTFTGRLLADSGALPDGKLEAVQAWCATHSRPFEYAFLLDALKEEQAQGVTIDSARCFFKSSKRHYIIIDAPGHIEFLKNMISGAARAEAAILLISAPEGIKENSKRHGLMLSLLGIKQVAVLINKMDLVGYDQSVFESIKAEYAQFLQSIGVKPAAWVPVSARQGDHLIGPSDAMPWYKGMDVLSVMDSFHKEKPLSHLPVRFPVQDVYKFTQHQDDRRIIAGTMVSGELHEGDEIVVYPSKKKSTIHRIEGFNVAPTPTVGPDQATGFTLGTQLFIKPGDVVSRVGEGEPAVGTCFRANVFWLGKQPLRVGRRYKLKTGTCKVQMVVTHVKSVLHSAELTSTDSAKEVARHEVGEIVIETLKPIAVDLVADHPIMSRFVIVDDYDIAGGGLFIAKDDHPDLPAIELEMDVYSAIDPGLRHARLGHRAAVVFITGSGGAGNSLGIEQELFELGITPMRLEGLSPFALPSVVTVANALLTAGLLVMVITRPEYVGVMAEALSPYDQLVTEDPTAQTIANWLA